MPRSLCGLPHINDKTKVKGNSEEKKRKKYKFKFNTVKCELVHKSTTKWKYLLPFNSMHP